MSSDLLSVAEAGKILGVSRRRAEALVLSGALPAQRVGSQWVIRGTALRQAEHNLWREAGRPMSQKTAWARLDHEPSFAQPSRSELDRSRRRLRARAEHVSLFVHPREIEKGTFFHVGVLGGRYAAIAHGVPIDEDGIVDLYLRSSERKNLLNRASGRIVSDSANLILHIIDDDCWPFEEQVRVVSPRVAWLDLADRNDRAADTLLDRLVGGRVHH